VLIDPGHGYLHNTTAGGPGSEEGLDVIDDDHLAHLVNPSK